MVIALSQSASLLVLFVVLPLCVGVVVMTLVARRPGPPEGTRTSQLLAHGTSFRGEVLNARAMGSFLDVRPMVRVEVRIDDGLERFELTVVQSMTRRHLGELEPGSTVEVRVNADRSAGAIALP